MPLPPLSSNDFGPYISRLADSSVDAEIKRGIATELRDFQDTHRDPNDLSKYLTTALPVLIQALRAGEPSFKKDSPEHQTRLLLLTTIQRLPHSESMKQYVTDIQGLMVHLLRTDNEDLGVICVKIVIDFNRTYRTLLESHVQPFIDWIVELYGGMPSVVEKTFSSKDEGHSQTSVGMQPSSSNPSVTSTAENDDRPLLPTSQSFKVLVECPIATVLFSDPETSGTKYSSQLVPSSIKFLQLQVEQQRVAHEESAKENNMWIGVAPGIKNRVAYTEFITAQIKVMSYIAYVFRQPHDQFKKYGEIIPTVAIRLLQDCPAEASAIRKDLIIAIRHALTEDIRMSFLAKLDSLLDERVLLGAGVASHEGLRPLAYTTLADLVHNIRPELSAEQLSRVIHAYSCNVHASSVPCGTQVLCMRLLVGLVEFVIAKCSRTEAARILTGLLETGVDKLNTLHRTYQDLLMLSESQRPGAEPEPILSFATVERAKPVDALSYVLESPENVIKDARVLFWTLLHSFKIILAGLRSVEGPVPDAEIMGQFFEDGLRCLVLYEKWPAPSLEKDVIDKFGEVFQEMAPHVFLEVWTLKFPFFMKHVLSHPNIMQLPQNLLANEPLSRQLVSVMLRHLVGDLDTLGNQNTRHAASTLRMFKMGFMAVTLLPDQNEMSLVPHIPRLIVDSFPLAAKSAEPTHYYLLLRALFRAIGGHKFDHLYREVLPLLQEMLENLNRLLITSEPNMRDLIAELCLTVPVKLTHLLPYLGHLMKPLVYALRAGPELVAQGLRTLELCIDNLTPEFLDPTLSPVLRDLMGALHDILKPLPAPHQSAHTTIRILGKLGGRNRRLQHEPPRLEYKPQGEEAPVLLSFGGRAEKVDISAMCSLAAKTLKHTNAVYRGHAFEYLKSSMGLLISKGPEDRQREGIFTTVDDGLFSAIHVPELMPQAHEYVRELSRHLFTIELGKNLASSLSRRTPFAPLVSLHVDAITQSLTVSDPKELERAKALLSSIVTDLAILYKDKTLPEGQSKDVLAILHLLASRFVGLCFEESVARKMAGYNGIVIFTSTDELGMQWVDEREMDFVRALMAIIKDTPIETAKNITDVTNTIQDILRACNAARPAETSTDVEMASTDAPPPTPQFRLRLPYLVGILTGELASSNALVRSTAQSSIELLSELSGKSINELLTPHRDRLLAPIFTRPLRALPLLNQIGHVDAVTYALNIRPPLPEVTEELWRMLNETLAVADADDSSLSTQTRITQRQNLLVITKLRIACIKLLTAAIPATDFFGGQSTTRPRVISVYFKSLYSQSAEVKDVASEGLQSVLTHQSRLPKELLHAGLRPILMNLGDPKRLTLANLDGLARLLGLLTNHFKVDIGSKLNDHFRILADVKMFREAANSPLVDNEEILKLVRIADIFHRLPYPGAGTFLGDLTNNIVQSETHLFSATPTPFSSPLGAYMNKYPVEAVDYLFANINQPRHVRTIRNVLMAKSAPVFYAELINQTPRLISTCLQGDRSLVTSGLLLCKDLAELDPEWFSHRDDIVQALLELWHAEFKPDPDLGYQLPTVRVKLPTILLAIFKTCLENHLRLDILFGIIAIYTQRIAIDLSNLTRFLHTEVAMKAPMSIKREIFLRFLHWFDEPSPPYDHITHFLRIVISPILIVSYDKPPSTELTESDPGLMDAEMIELLHSKIWKPMLGLGLPGGGPNDALIIELMHMSGLLIQHCPDLMHEARKDVMKFAWASVQSEDAVVKQTSSLLIARFFKAYESPRKLILQVWVGLLRPQPQNEGRHLIRQAVDILAPALPTRITADSNPPSWAKVTRRFLMEEGNGLSPMITIYRVIMRHQELFFPYRELFVTHMVNSLPKLGLGPTGMLETRMMTLEVTEHILRWERHKAKLSEASDKGGDTEMQNASSSAVADTWTMPAQLRESCVTFLVRLVMNAGSDGVASKQIIVARALRTLRELLNLPGWSDVTIKPLFFDRALVQPEITDETLAHTTNAIRLLKISIDDKPASWFVENIHLLQSWLEKPLNSSEVNLHELVTPIMDKVISAIPSMSDEDDAPPHIKEFHTFVNSLVGEGLRSSSHLPLTLAILLSVVGKSPTAVEELAPNLMKVFTKQCRDHVYAIQAKAPTDTTSRLLKSTLEICRIQVPVSGEARKSLINGMLLLVDKSTDTSLCRLILDICREWVFKRTEAVPTMREKSNVLQKMTTFESKRGDDALFVDYLELIYDIYKEPSLHRTDLTTRLEPAFLIGCRYKDPVIRSKFALLFDESLPRSLSSRLQYVLGSQSWEYLAEHNWIAQALDLLLGAIDENQLMTPAIYDTDMEKNDSYNFGTKALTIGDLVRPMRHLLHLDPEVTHQMWISIFSAVWRVLSRKEQTDVSRSLILLLGKEYHSKQLTLPRNVIQSLLAGALACHPPLALPPYVVKYLGKSFNAWHVALELLQESLQHIRDEETVRDATLDALAELYAELSEDDMFYGLWRRRALYHETNVAVSFEQNGLWPEAQTMYESAQIRARQGGIPFSESEYCMWEDHWILSAQKMQQWDVLTDFANQEGNHDLLLECAWRLSDWNGDRETIERSIQAVSDVPTPRRRVFEAYTALIRGNPTGDRTEFIRLLEDAMQLSLRKWVSLPPIISMVHVPLLQHFQQLVELQEAAQIFHALAVTNASNLEKRSADLKVVLQAWRERLPNLWDDIGVWSDLVAWRQHVFGTINKHFLPLIPSPPSGQGVSGSASTSGYRGYHETAWIINRFAHVARKHHLLEVCHNSLAKIYTLPNIEISEAFLKLREQARCHYQVSSELQAGLEVINNTNLMYFSPPQKAEFFTLKGMFIAKLGHNEDANAAFGQAVSMDLNMPKAWAEWGRYNDRMFKDSPTEMTLAANAVSCYLQAAGLYKNSKTRPLLIRVLWFLSLDDAVGTVSKAFESFKGDVALWYWITLIPQLLLSLSHREARHARRLLMELAKTYPQALFFHLRTVREDYAAVRKQTLMTAAANAAQVTASIQSANAAAGSAGGDTSSSGAQEPPTPGAENAKPEEAGTTESKLPESVTVTSQPTPQPITPFPGHPDNTSRTVRHPWEYVDEINAILKTAFPLLAPTLELMVEQIGQRFKPTQEEEIYRFISALLTEGIYQSVGRNATPGDDGSVPEICVTNIARLAGSLPSSTRFAFEEDLVKSKPTMKEYVERLQMWRDRYELHLDMRPRVQPLDLISHWLVEFQHLKYDDVEVPGQYLEHKDGPANFVRIARFSSVFELCRGNSFCFRRIAFLGHDGTKHSFAVQLPSARSCRREERIMQLFRIFNAVLSRRKESRKRNLSFHVPLAVPFTPSLRLLENDASYVTLQDIYDQHCQTIGIAREEPMITSSLKIRAMMDPQKPLTNVKHVNLRMELMDEVSSKWVPKTILADYMARTMNGPMELWLMRKQFTLQVAAVSFMSYVIAGAGRIPSRLHVSRSTGLIYSSELLPALAQNGPMLQSSETVPFRFTPNMQHFVTPNGMEGLMTSGMLAIGRCLTEPEYDLEQQLSLFLRDEVLTWYNIHNKTASADIVFRGHVAHNVDVVVKRAEVMACKYERENTHPNSSVPASQAVSHLISVATNPQNLAKMPEQWYAYF